MKIAVVGSRDYPHLDDVRALVRLIASREAEPTIVSGGAKGTDTAAEQAAHEAGLQVVSYRVRSVKDDEHAIEEWRFGPRENFVRVMIEEPSWANYTSALLYRDALIAEHADRVVAFRGTEWRGTSLTLDFAHAYDRPVRIYDADENRFGQ